MQILEASHSVEEMPDRAPEDIEAEGAEDGEDEADELE